MLPDAARPDRRRVRNRAAILTAAEALFAARGVEAVSIDEIAAAADLAKGTLYNHFADKDALFTAVLDAYHPYRDLLAALETDTGETKAEYFRTLIKRVREILKKVRTDLLPLAFMDVVEFQGRHLRAMVGEIAPKFLQTLPTVMRKSGKLNVVDIRQVYLILFANILGYMVVRLILGDRLSELFGGISEEQWFDTQMDVCLRGLTAPKGQGALAGPKRRAA